MTAVTVKILGGKMFLFYFWQDILWIWFHPFPLQSVPLCVDLSNSTKGSRLVPSPMAYEQHPCQSLDSPAEVWEPMFAFWSGGVCWEEKNSLLSPNLWGTCEPPLPAFCLSSWCLWDLSLSKASTPLQSRAEMFQKVSKEMSREPNGYTDRQVCAAAQHFFP